MLCLLFSLACNKDEEFIDLDQQSNTEDTYPFKRGSIIAEDTAEFNFLEELFGYSSFTLEIEIEAKGAGKVTFNGFALEDKANSFTFNWGDGNILDRWFPHGYME
jgi:hypothetical protein